MATANTSAAQQMMSTICHVCMPSDVVVDPEKKMTIEEEE